jgi:hypothetical protein
MYTYINLKNEVHIITHVELDFLKSLESSGSVEIDHKNKIIRCIKK